MTITDTELTALQDERLDFANSRLDDLEKEFGPITAEAIARPFAQWIHLLNMIEFATDDAGASIEYDEQYRNRAQALADELNRAGNMLMTCLERALLHKDKSWNAGEPIRSIFEAVTGLPWLRVHLLDTTALRGVEASA